MDKYLFTFGIKEIDISKFNKVGNQVLNKPTGGIWACYYKTYENPSIYVDKILENLQAERDVFNLYKIGNKVKGGIKYKLKKDAKVLFIEDYSDFMDYLLPYYVYDRHVTFVSSENRKIVDWQKLSYDFDAIFVSSEVLGYNGDMTIRYGFNHNDDIIEGLALFDIQSFCIFNPYCIDIDSVEYIDLTEIIGG